MFVWLKTILPTLATAFAIIGQAFPHHHFRLAAACLLALAAASALIADTYYWK